MNRVSFYAKTVCKVEMLAEISNKNTTLSVFC